MSIKLKLFYRSLSQSVLAYDHCFHHRRCFRIACQPLSSAFHYSTSTMARPCEEGCKLDRYVSVSDLPKLQRAGHFEIEMHYLKLHVRCYCKKVVRKLKHHH